MPPAPASTTWTGWKYEPKFIAASGSASRDLAGDRPLHPYPGHAPAGGCQSLGVERPACRWSAAGWITPAWRWAPRTPATGGSIPRLAPSAWIAVSSEQPVLDKVRKPYVFTHVMPGMFTSAVSIFSGRHLFNWVKDNLVQNLVEEASANRRGCVHADEPRSRQSTGRLEQAALQPQPGGRHLAGCQRHICAGRILVSISNMASPNSSVRPWKASP